MGCNTNPKGGNRLWRTRYSRNRTFDTRSALTPLKLGFQGQRASIRTRRGEIDYGEQLRHGFAETRPRRKMSSVFGIRHTSSGSTSHGSDTRRRLSERPEDEVRGKADSSTNELKKNRGAAFGRPTKGAGGLRPPAPFVALFCARKSIPKSGG